MVRRDRQINLRIPSDLKARIEAAAVENRRSMNAEIEERLEKSFEVPPAAEHLDFRELRDGALDGLMESAILRLIEQRPDIFTKLRKK